MMLWIVLFGLVIKGAAILTKSSG